MIRLNKRTFEIKKSLSIILLLMTTFTMLSQTARVKFVIGKVEYRKSGESKWKRVQMQTLLRQGDQIKTAFESKIEIRTPDKTIVRLHENSVLDLNMIKKVGKKKTANKFKLWSGRIWGKFTKLFAEEEENTISTPTAVAAIRGTTLEVKHNPATGQSAFDLKEGLVEVRTPKGNQALKPGKKFDVDKSGTIEESTGNGAGSDSDDSSFSPSDSSKTKGGTASANKGQNFLDLDQSSGSITDEADISGGLKISGKTRADATLSINGQGVSLGSDGSFSKMLTAREGKFMVSVKSNSSFGEIKKDLSFRINVSTPELFLSNTGGQVYTAESNYELSIQGTDATAEEVLTLSINGNTIETAASPLNSSTRIQLSSGSNEITVELRDEVGHTVEESFEVILDNITPEIQLSPISIAPILPTTSFGEQPPGVPNFPYRVQPRQIIGQVIDQDISSVEEIFINGEQVLVENGNFSYLLELNNEVIRALYNDGRDYFELNFIVKDKAGNELTQTELIEIVRLSSE